MGLQIKSASKKSNLVISLVAVFALVAQPMYGLVASRVANALGSTVTIYSGTELRDAIKNQQDGQTWNIIAGNYALAPFDDITAGGSHGSAQTGWYFPITANNLTINGAGSNNTTIYGTGYSPNGNWATQNFVSIFGNNVTLNNLTLMPKVDGNKVIEVMGNNSTINNVTVTPNTLSVDDYNSSPAMYREWYKRWGGSIYYNHAGTGHTISNTIINNGGLSNHNSTLTISGVSLSHLLNNEFDYVYGNAVSEGGVTTGTPKFIYHLNSETGSVAATMPNIGVGDTIELDSDVTTNNQITLSESNVTLNGNGHTITNNRDNSVKDNSNNSAIGIQANGVTVNKLTIDGTGGVSMHGINAYEATGVNLNSVILQNNSNAGLIVGKDSNVTVRDITTKDNVWYGINVDRKAGTSSTLTVLGTSSHNEDSKAHIWIDNRGTGNTVNDPNAQYARYWEGNGYKYLLDRTKPTAELTVDSFNPGSFNIKATDDQRLTRIDYSLWKNNDTTQIGVWGHTVDWNDRNNFVKTFTQYCDHGGNHNNPCVTKNFTSDLAEGTYQLRATATDVMGKQTNAITREFTVDRTAPTAPEFKVDGKTGSLYTNLYNPTASWNQPSSDTVKYEYNYCNDIVGDTYNCAINSWSTTLTGTSRAGGFTQGEGVHHMKVRAIDAAGNVSGWSNVVTVTYDKTAPTSSIDSHDVTDNSLIFKGKVSDTNLNYYYCYLTTNQTITVDGYTFTAGQEVRLNNDVDSSRNSACKTKWANGTTEFNSTLGGFNITNVPDGSYTINLVAYDKATNNNAATPTTYTFDLNRTPVAPIINSIAQVTVGSPVVVTGTGTVGDTVAVTLNGVTTSATVDNNGLWSLNFANVPVGTYEVTAVASRSGVPGSSAASNQRSAVVNPATTEIPATNGPQTTTPTIPPTTTANLLANLTPTPFIPADNTDATDTDDNGAVAGARTNNNGDNSENGQVLSAEDAKDSWSLVNLLLTIGIGVASIITLLGLLGSNRKDRKLAGRLLTIVPAAGAIIALLLIEDFSGSMIWVNIWSLLIGALAVAQMIILGTSKSSTNE